MKHSFKLLLVGVVSAAAGAISAQDANEIRIGFAAPLSGPQAGAGLDTQYGAQLAVEDLNNRGVTIGGRPVKFKLVSEDDAADPKQAAVAAAKLVDQKVVGVVGHLNSGPSIAAAKVYFDAGLPQITPSATNPKYTQQGFATTFRIVANDDALGAATADYATRQLKATRVAVIDDRTAYGQGIADVFERVARKNGAEVVVTRQFTSDSASDFSVILNTLKPARPDVIFFGGIANQAVPMLRQMKELGIGAYFISGDGICFPSLASNAGGTVNEKVICAVGGAPPSKMPKAAEIGKRVERRYGASAVGGSSPYAYDAVMLLAAAMQKAGSADPKQVLPALAAIQYDGVTGPISFDKSGERNNPATTLFSFPGGKWTALD